MLFKELDSTKASDPPFTKKIGKIYTFHKYFLLLFSQAVLLFLLWHNLEELCLRQFTEICSPFLIRTVLHLFLKSEHLLCIKENIFSTKAFEPDNKNKWNSLNCLAMSFLMLGDTVIVFLIFLVFVASHHTFCSFLFLLQQSWSLLIIFVVWRVVATVFKSLQKVSPYKSTDFSSTVNYRGEN